MLSTDGRAVLVSVVVAAFCAAVAHALTCNEQHACLKAGTCRKTANATSLGCSFRMSLSAAGARLLNASNGGHGGGGDLTGTRGVCAPGMQQSVSVHTDAEQCTRRRLFPDALNAEIQLPPAVADAEQAPEHRRWCGAWIDARPALLVDETKWAFFDADDVTADVDAVIAARGSSRVAGQDVAKFRSACRAMLGSGALGVAAQQAYEHLLGALQVDNLVTTDREQVLRAVGRLAAHACDAPATVGLTDAGATFAHARRRRRRGRRRALSDALYAVGASPRRARRRATLPGRWRTRWKVNAANAAFAIGEADADAVARGAHPSDGRARLARIGQPGARRVCARGRAGARRGHALLRARLAAHCAHALRTAVGGEQGGLVAIDRAHHRGHEVPTAPAVAGATAPRPPSSGRARSAGSKAGRARCSTPLCTSTGRICARPRRRRGPRCGRFGGGLAPSAKEQCLAAARLVYPDAFDRLAGHARDPSGCTPGCARWPRRSAGAGRGRPAARVCGHPHRLRAHGHAATPGRRCASRARRAGRGAGAAPRSRRRALPPATPR